MLFVLFYGLLSFSPECSGVPIKKIYSCSGVFELDRLHTTNMSHFFFSLNGILFLFPLWLAEET